MPSGNVGGASLLPAGPLSVSFIDVGQGDGVLVQAGGGNYLIDAGRVEEEPGREVARRHGGYKSPQLREHLSLWLFAVMVDRRRSACITVAPVRKHS